MANSSMHIVSKLGMVVVGFCVVVYSFCSGDRFDKQCWSFHCSEVFNSTGNSETNSAADWVAFKNKESLSKCYIGRALHIPNFVNFNFSHSSNGEEIKCGDFSSILFLNWANPSGPETEEDWEPGMVQQDDSDAPALSDQCFEGRFSFAGLWINSIAPPPDCGQRPAITLS